MMSATASQTGDLIAQLQSLAHTGAQNAAEGLGTMIHRRVKMTIPRISFVPLADLAQHVGGADQEVVGIYLVTMGDLPGHIMLVLPYDDALYLTDMLLEQPTGTTHALDALARSALSEVDNLTAAFFLNAVAAVTGLEIRPSPPAVMVDMLGAILDVILVAVAAASDEIILMETHFAEEGEGGRSIRLHLWVVPDLDPLQDVLSRPVQRGG